MNESKVKTEMKSTETWRIALHFRK